MKIITKAVLSFETMDWIQELEESYEYSGPLALCNGGASGAASENEQAQTAFYNDMTSEQQTTFGESQDVLNQLKSTWSPILAAGPYQYGFSTAEDAALRSDIEGNYATQTENTENAAQLREQQATGGANAGPAGGQAAVNAQIAATGGQAEAGALSQEKLAGYEAGSNLFSNASNALGQTAQLENPVGTAGVAVGAGSSATGSINLVDQENANSLLNKVLGGVAGGAMSAVTGGLGNLDSTGSSSGSEQIGNFITGL